MLGSFIEGLLRSASADSVTDVILVAMLLVFGLACTAGRRGKAHGFVGSASSLLVSIGILGTFIGIVIGLLDFDAANIQGSIARLLDGLRVAFLTSVVGMLLSVVLKFLDNHWFVRARKRAETPDAVTPEHIYSVMKQQAELLETISRSLSGSEEGSVAGQVKLLRSDMNDFRSSLSRDQREFETKLFVRLQQFSDVLARSATETVIEALRQVIQDFNRHLVDQFGDNFKALNDAVVKMVAWQDAYKLHIEALERRIDNAVQELERTAKANEAISLSLQSSETSIGSIENHCQSIPVAISRLEPVLRVNQNQLQELERHIEVFSALRDSATRAVPELQAHMDRLSQDLADKSEAIMQKLTSIMVKMHEGSQEFGRSVDQTNIALTEAAHVVSEKSEHISQTLADASEDFGSSVRGTIEGMARNAGLLEQQMAQAIGQAAASMTDAFRSVSSQIHQGVNDAIEATLKSMRSSVESSLSDTQEQLRSSGNRTLGAVEAQVRDATERANSALNAQLTAMERAIERELEKVFREMGSALATISRRIADDHAELTQRLHAA